MAYSNQLAKWQTVALSNHQLGVVRTTASATSASRACTHKVVSRVRFQESGHQSRHRRMTESDRLRLWPGLNLPVAVC
jgi:hypothetical protein